MAKDRAKRRNLTRIARRMPNNTVVVYFPHGIKEPDKEAGAIGKRVCQAAYRVMVRCDVVGLQIVDQLDLTLTKEDIEKVSWIGTTFLSLLVIQTMYLKEMMTASISERLFSIFVDLLQMLYNSSVVFPDEMMDKIHERQCIVQMIQKITPIPLERRHSSTSRTSIISVGEILNVIEDTMASLIYGDTKDPHNPREDS